MWRRRYAIVNALKIKIIKRACVGVNVRDSTTSCNFCGLNYVPPVPLPPPTAPMQKCNNNKQRPVTYGWA